jgi:glycosyltransferase involved in cell wall biosynthesis
MRLALVTIIPYWVGKNGQFVHINALVEFLAARTELSVYYLGSEATPHPAHYSLHHFPCEEERGAALLSFALHVHKARYDIAILEYLYLYWLAEFFTPPTKVYLHAHELLSARTEAYTAFGRTPHLPITPELERKILGTFAKVIFAQEEEAEKAAAWIGRERCAVCWHPVSESKSFFIRENVESIRFLGSRVLPNQDGIRWFHDHVLPLLGDLGEKCSVHGSIADAHALRAACPHLPFAGVVEDLDAFYQEADIVINPLLYGSGLKIKTVEALGYSRPLVTTPAGAQGLRRESGRSFLVADTPHAFADALLELAHSRQKRQQLSLAAHAYCREVFTPERCFQALLQ